jgi:hypothetical protein
MTAESFAPVTSATNGDLERFSAAYGTFRWCSCMRWRLRSAPFRDAGKDGRAVALAERVLRAEPVGVLEDVPVPDGSRPVMRRPSAPRPTPR